MNITCSVSSCLCQGTCLPGAYCTRQRSTCSPPIACSRTPLTNSQESRPFHVRDGRDSAVSGLDTEVPLASVRRDRCQRDLLVVDDPFAVTPRLRLRGE